MSKEFATNLVNELNRRIKSIAPIELEAIRALEEHRDAIITVMRNMGHEI